MTIYTGKDVVVKIDAVQESYATEASIEIDNGQDVIKVLGQDTLKDIINTQDSISGSFSVTYTDYTTLQDIVNLSDIKTLSFELGGTPDYTLTFNNTSLATGSLSFEIDAAVVYEVTFEAETATLT